MTPLRPASLLGRVGVLFLAAAAAGTLPEPIEAQWSFGRNKVQYDRFDFRVLTTDHFDIHYYREEAEAVEDLTRMSERWYERFARTFQHEFEARKPLIIYADHPDFQQTNTLSGFIGEGTGGVTESLKNRVIMPLAGSYADTDHVLGHELVHAFQYNIAQGRRGGGLQGLYSLPLWLIEGMAEYLSVGRDDPLTAMWLRDALLRDDFPTIEQMTKEQRFFPYRFGQALWAYIGGVYGDDAIVQLFRRSLRIGFQPAIQQVLGVSPDTLSSQWRETVASAYQPLMEGRTAPVEAGRLILGPETGSGDQNIAPALSPDGRYVAFISEKDLFSVNLYLADTETGKILRKLSSATSDAHADALRYIDSSGTWSPDGARFAYVVFDDGDNQLVIIDVQSGDVRDKLSFEGIGAINNPAWSPDGRQIAFSGMRGGISDLYTFDLEERELTQLTNDKHADFHPTWSPDGRTLAFTSDRGPETDFERLTYSEYRIALLDLQTRGVRPLQLMGNARHSNPAYGADSNTLYFLSDADGFADVYRTDLASGRMERVTRIATAVSGITAMSPALSVAGGTMAFSVFSDFGFTIHTKPTDSPGAVVAARGDSEPGRALPPVDPDRFSRVAEYLADASTGLPAPGYYQSTDAEAYDPSLALDYVSQPTIGVGTDRFGSYAGGGAQALFSDMLGDKILGVAIQAQGTFKDIGGQAVYADLGRRWNWALQGGRIPYLLLFQSYGANPDQGAYLSQVRQRIYLTNVGGVLAYPFSQTRRVEGGLGFTRYSYDVEEDRYFIDEFGRVLGYERVQRDDLERDALNLGQASLALVGDYSFFGFTSPIRGGRYRLELEATVGTVEYMTAIADWRRYWSPHRNLTVAFRGLHYGRYGLEQYGLEEGQQDVIRPLYLGYESLIRGYAIESIDIEECTIGSTQDDDCPTFSRLQGQRIGLANLELRLPLVGTEQFGLINFPYLPTELVAFFDAGAAWDDTGDVNWKWKASSSERVPVFSTGVSARFNLLGFLILESYYAYPFQRPEKGWHWGFSLAPGW
jgi:Tol biopolymer transport system component